MTFDPFRNKGSALVLVGLVALAAAGLVGSEDHGGPLDFAAKRAGSHSSLSTERRPPKAAMPPAGRTRHEPGFAGGNDGMESFAPDPEWIGETEEFDAPRTFESTGGDQIMLETGEESPAPPTEDEEAGF